MKIYDAYRLAIETGMKHDPRPREEVDLVLSKAKKAYDELPDEKKELFDTESLWNPYYDCRFAWGEEIAKETEAEHRPLPRYVYVYYVDGEQQTIIQEQQLNDNQLREIIGSTRRVSALTYLLFALFLLIVGGYCLYRSVKIARKRKKTQKVTKSA